LYNVQAFPSHVRFGWGEKVSQFHSASLYSPYGYVKAAPVSTHRISKAVLF